MEYYSNMNKIKLNNIECINKYKRNWLKKHLFCKKITASVGVFGRGQLDQPSLIIMPATAHKSQNAIMNWFCMKFDNSTQKENMFVQNTTLIAYILVL